MKLPPLKSLRLKFKIVGFVLLSHYQETKYDSCDIAGSGIQCNVESCEGLDN